MSSKVINAWEYPSVKAELPHERFLKVIMSPEVNGYEKATVLFSYFPPGSTTGIHSHDSDEIMYVVGHGKSVMDGEECEIQTDSVIFAPKGVDHECRNSSETETLKLFCIFIPPTKPMPVLKQSIAKTKEYLKKQLG